MGGVMVAVEAKTEQEAKEQMEHHKKEAERYGLIDRGMGCGRYFGEQLLY